MDTNELLSVLDDPEKMQQIMNLASQLMGSSDAASPTISSDSPPSSPDVPTELIQRVMPALSAIAQSGQHISSDRLRLLTAMRPFLSERAGQQIEHAERILSMARMTKTAAEQLLPQQYGKKEV